MTVAQWITLVIAILGVLHGPLAVRLVNTIKDRKDGR
jgi:hypothetical protein